MTDVLTRLQDANPVRSEDLAPSIERVWQRLEDCALAEHRPPGRGFFRPLTKRRVWRRLLIVAAGSVAVVIAVLVFGTAGSGPSRAFAGWTTKPTAAARDETANALARCATQLAGARGPRSGVPSGTWKPLLTDTRGPFTAMILQSGDASATCLNGPSFTSTAASATQGGGASEHTLSIHAAGAAPRGGAPSVSVMGLGGSGSGPIRTASQVHTSTSGGQPYTIVQGQVDAHVTRLTLVLSNGRDVQATVGDGSFIVWWPGSSAATSARLTSASGVTTEPLAFTRLPVPPRPPAGASR